MSASEREAEDVPYLQKTPTGWRYRRRIMPRALAAHLGRVEWKSPIFKLESQAVRECERLTPIHDEIIGRWKNGQAVDDAPEFTAAVEAKAQFLVSLRPEAYEAAVEGMEYDAFRRMLSDTAVARLIREYEIERGGPVTPKSAPPYGPFDVDLTEFAQRLGEYDGGDLAAIDVAAIKAAKDGGIHRPQTMPLSRAYARDVKEYGGKRDEKRIKYAVDAFKAAVGDIDFFTLKRAHVEKWVKVARTGARERPWSDATVKRRTVALQGIHSRLLIAFDLPASSVWRKLDLSSGGGADDRLPLNAAHLKALDGYLGKKKTKAALALTIMRFTGIGPAELVGLRKEDFVLGDEIPYVIVRSHDERGLKTKTRERWIPLIGPALSAAKTAVATAPSEYVFVKEMTTNAAGSLSALGNKTLRAAGIPKSRRLTCYSLRHGLAEAMKLADMREDLRKYVLGHAQKGVTPRYGSSAPLRAQLAEALKKAHGELGKVDDSIYKPSELMPKKLSR